MILHTIVDPDKIWARELDSKQTIEVICHGVSLEVTRKDEKTVVINRILSTDLKHYLNPGLQPGIELGYTLTSRE